MWTPSRVAAAAWARLAQILRVAPLDLPQREKGGGEVLVRHRGPRQKRLGDPDRGPRLPRPRDGRLGLRRVNGKPGVLQDLGRRWPRGHLLRERRPQEAGEARHRRGHQMEGRLARLGGLHDVLNSQATLHEDPARGADRSGASGRDLVDHHLHDRDAHAEDVAPGEPRAGVQSLGRDVARRAARHAVRLRRHGTRDAKVDQDDLGAEEVACLQHDVRLLDVAMHHGLLMHEGEALEALPQDAPEPRLGHRHALGSSTRLEGHEVTPMVGLAHHVVELGVLEELEDVRNPLAAQLLQRLELLLQLLEARRAHLRLLQALDAHLLAKLVRGQLDYALATSPQLLRHYVASLLWSLHGHVNMGVVESELFAVLPEVEFDQLVSLVDLQHSVAVKVKADVSAAELAESVLWYPQGLREDGPELLEAREADALRAAVDLLEALHHGLLQDVPVLEQVGDGLNGRSRRH
mmetsp:Transcript_5277/g.16996  ORF Transcript_5277/g.16996 Transcript_5277/m.16996 type:complete len:464 (-) Transcript_5277:416-1807(-)